MSNPKRIRQLVTRMAVSHLQRETATIVDQTERSAKMIALAQEAFDTINEGIDLLEKELTYQPQQLLGVAMYPDRITGLISAAVFYAVALASKYFTN